MLFLQSLEDNLQKTAAGRILLMVKSTNQLKLNSEQQTVIADLISNHFMTQEIDMTHLDMHFYASEINRLFPGEAPVRTLFLILP